MTKILDTEMLFECQMIIIHTTTGTWIGVGVKFLNFSLFGVAGL